MDLLSSGQFQDIRDVIRSVTDTFHKKPIVMHRLSKSLDRFQEGGPRTSADTVLLGFVEFDDETTDESKERIEGSVKGNTITVTFNLNYLEELGTVLDANRNFIYQERRDKLSFQGQRYIIDLITYDGLLEDKYELVIIEATRDEHG